MFDLLFSTFRKATESTLQLPVEFFKTWTQQLLTMQPRATGAPYGGTPYEWSRQLQKRSNELVIETLHKNRETLDATYRAGIQLIEQTFRLSDAKSSEEIRQVSEDLWRKLLDVVKQQSDAQVRDFQSWASRTIEIQQKSAAPVASA
jgi:hypothetical protein